MSDLDQVDESEPPKIDRDLLVRAKQLQSFSELKAFSTWIRPGTIKLIAEVLGAYVTCHLSPVNIMFKIRF